MSEEDTTCKVVVAEASPAPDWKAQARGRAVQAEYLKVQGNEHLREQRLPQAAGAYRQALELLRETETSSKVLSPLGQILRLNLAACLQRLGNAPTETLQLCDEVLAADAGNAGALLRRADARLDMARSLPRDAETRKEALSLARQDLIDAKRADPRDLHVCEQFQLLSEQLRELDSEAGAAVAAAAAMNAPQGDPPEDDVGKAQDEDNIIPPSLPPHPVAKVVPLINVVPPDQPGRMANGLQLWVEPGVASASCSNGDHHPGHARCGKSYWLEQRAAWIRMPLEVVAVEPADFEDDGILCPAVKARRLADAAEVVDAEARAAVIARYTVADDGGEISDLSDSERDLLEDCIDATERPYPDLKRPLPLVQAVRCAEEIWEDED